MLWSSLPWSDIFVLYMYLFVCIFAELNRAIAELMLYSRGWHFYL